MRKTATLVSIFGVLALLIGGFMWLYSSQYLIGKASVVVKEISVDNSYVFVSPIRSKANNDEKIRVTVFVLNSQGLGVIGQKVTLASDQSLVSEGIQPVTDNFGKAIYDIGAIKPGEYYLEVKVGQEVLPQKAHLSFY